MDADAAEEVVAGLKVEQRTLRARLDAIELALANLEALYPPPPSKARRLEAALEERARVLRALAGARRGRTAAELRVLTAGLPAYRRAIALHSLKRAGRVTHRGGRWFPR